MWGSKGFNNGILVATIALVLIVVTSLPLTQASALNTTAIWDKGPIRTGQPASGYKSPLVPTPRDFFLGNENQGITDIQNILNTLTGGNIGGGTGTVVFIIIAAATAIFWIIIFLIIYYSIYAKKSKEEEGYGGGYGYSEMSQQSHGHGHGRSFIPDGIMNRITDMAWKALDKLALEYGKI